MLQTADELAGGTKRRPPNRLGLGGSASPLGAVASAKAVRTIRRFVQADSQALAFVMLQPGKNSCRAMDSVAVPKSDAVSVSVWATAHHLRSSGRTTRPHCIGREFPRHPTLGWVAGIRCPLAAQQGLRSSHRRQPMFAQYSFRPRRWRCLVSQQFPDTRGKLIHSHVPIGAESIAIRPECK
jgi:hypothetical protein